MPSGILTGITFSMAPTYKVPPDQQQLFEALVNTLGGASRGAGGTEKFAEVPNFTKALKRSKVVTDKLSDTVQDLLVESEDAAKALKRANAALVNSTKS